MSDLNDLAEDNYKINKMLKTYRNVQPYIIEAPEAAIISIQKSIDADAFGFTDVFKQRKKEIEGCLEDIKNDVDY